MAQPTLTGWLLGADSVTEMLTGVVPLSPSRRLASPTEMLGVEAADVARNELLAVFHRVASSAWSEGTVTWDNQPVADTATLATLGAVSAGASYEVDVTPLVTADGVYTIGFESSSTNGAYYSSKEGAAAPQLIVTVSGGSAGDTAKPSVPGSLVATATSATRVDLGWAASTDNVGVTGYEVRRDGVLLATVATTAYADATVVASTAYVYTVVARDAAGNSSDPATASVTTPAGGAIVTLTFVPTADAFVDASVPGTNYGTNVSLRVDGSPLKRAYVRFVVSGATGVVKKATLQLWANSASSAGYQVGVVTDTTWAEGTITGANAPPIGAPVASSGAHAASMIVEVDVTSLVSGNGTYNLGLTTPSSTQINYGSRESSTPPALIVTLG